MAVKPLTTYGGQAVIEGVMMRDRHRVAIAVRAPNGQIMVREDELHGTPLTDMLRQFPIARGMAALIDSIGVGTRALLWSAQVSQGEAKPSISFDDPAVGLGIGAASLGMSAMLFFAAPTAASSFVERILGVRGRLASNLIETTFRLALLVGYMTAVAKTPEGNRLFSYHGAEHKTVNAYEAGAPLTPESVARFPLSHPRCGTAFVLTVALISTLVSLVIGRPPLAQRVLLRLLLLPLIAGIAYEAIQYSAQHLDSPTVRVLIAPNLLFQRLTTREPDLKMIEVAIQALERVLAAD